MMRKVISFLIVLVMLLTMNPVSVFASGGGSSTVQLTLQCVEKGTNNIIGTKKITISSDNPYYLSSLDTEAATTINDDGISYKYDSYASSYNFGLCTILSITNYYGHLVCQIRDSFGIKYSAYASQSDIESIVKLCYTAQPLDMSNQVNATGYTGVYDGKAHNAVSVTAPSGAAISYRTSTSGTWSATVPTVKNVADSKVIYIKVTKKNYADVTTQAAATVNRAEISVTANNLSKAYQAEEPSEFTYTSTAAINGETAAFSGKLTRAPGEIAGTYAITQGTLNLINKGSFSAGNYTLVYHAGTFTIAEPLNMAVSATGYTGVYDGRTHNAVVSVTAPSGAAISYRMSTSGTWSTRVPTVKNVADSKVIYIKVTKSGYADVTTQAAATVNRAEISVTAKNLSKAYQAEEPSEFTYTNTAAVKRETAAFSGTLTRDPGEIAGTYAITQGTLALKNNGSFSAGNYTLVYHAGIFTIAEPLDMTKEVSATGYTGVYDGEEHDAVSVTVPEKATVSYKTSEQETWSATAPTVTNVSDSKTVYIKVTKTGYADVTIQAEATVNRAEISVTANNLDKAYQAEDPLKYTYTNTTAVNGENAAFSGALTRDSGETAGTYAITKGTLVLTDDGSFLEGNYTLVYHPGAFTIAKPLDMTKEVSATGYTGVYNGVAYGITVTAPEAADVRYGMAEGEYSDDNPQFKDAGISTVYFEVTRKGYETVTGSAVVNIKKASLTITADSASKIYDGNALTASGWKNTTPSGLVAGDIIKSVDVTGSAINVGTADNIASNAKIVRMGSAEEENPAMTAARAVAATQAEVDVTGNYVITYNKGMLTITSSGSSSRHHNTTATTINEEQVPLAGVPELNRVDHFNYIKGYENGTVRPQNNITREEVTAIFYRLLTDASRQIFITKDENFSDIASNRWSLNGIATLANGGIIEGYNDGTFGATKAITRAEFAAIVSRFDTMGDTEGTNFSDISGHWAEKYIKSAAKKGWITGYSDGTFKPNQYITRAEAMTLINRVLDRKVDAAGLTDGYKVFPDNKAADWFYYQVIEATNNHDYAERKNVSDTETWTKIKEDKTWVE